MQVNEAVTRRIQVCRVFMPIQIDAGRRWRNARDAELRQTGVAETALAAGLARVSVLCYRRRGSCGEYFRPHVIEFRLLHAHANPIVGVACDALISDFKYNAIRLILNSIEHVGF